MKVNLFKALHAADIVVIEGHSVDRVAEMGDLALVTLEHKPVLEFEDQDIELDARGHAHAVDVDQICHLIEFRVVSALTAAHIEAHEEA